MAAVNRLLLVICAAVLGSHTFLSRGLDYDGSHNLFYMIAEEAIYNIELSRKFFDFFYQLPAYLFIKLSSSSSLSTLIALHSFGLIWIHIISIIGCFLILPKDRKNLLFFPLFAFLTGPMTGLGISVSVGLSVCSYIWFAAFVLYYSDLSCLRHRLLFFLAPLPLLFSHELISYMALPLGLLCLWKYQKESVLFNKLLIQITIGVLVLCSFLAFLFLFSHDTLSNNREAFFSVLKRLEFIYFYGKVNFPVVISILLIGFFGLSVALQKEKKLSGFGMKESALRNPFFKSLSSVFLIAWFRGKAPIILFLLIGSVSGFFLFFWLVKTPVDFPMEDDYRARVYIPCLALPVNFLFWWFFKEKAMEFRFRKCPWLLLSLVIAGVTFTSWRLRSDWLFYRHRVEFSEALSRFQGILEWDSVQDEFSNILFNRKISSWKIVPSSLMYPASRNVQAVLVWTHSNYMNVCMQEKSRYKKSHCNSFCETVSFPSKGLTAFSVSSRFFDFSRLLRPLK